MSLCEVLALPRKVLRREKERMEMTERMNDGAEDHECANGYVSACERGKEKKGETRRSLDSPDALFGTVSLEGELSSDYSQIRMTVLDLEKKR